MSNVRQHNSRSHRQSEKACLSSKIDHGPGYRVYFVERKGRYVLLLAGGDKLSQEQDIRKARELARV